MKNNNNLDIYHEIQAIDDNNDNLNHHKKLKIKKQDDDFRFKVILLSNDLINYYTACTIDEYFEFTYMMECRSLLINKPVLLKRDFEFEKEKKEKENEIIPWHRAIMDFQILNFVYRIIFDPRLQINFLDNKKDILKILNERTKENKEELQNNETSKYGMIKAYEYIWKNEKKDENQLARAMQDYFRHGYETLYKQLWLELEFMQEGKEKDTNLLRTAILNTYERHTFKCFFLHAEMCEYKKYGLNYSNHYDIHKLISFFECSKEDFNNISFGVIHGYNVLSKVSDDECKLPTESELKENKNLKREFEYYIKEINKFNNCLKEREKIMEEDLKCDKSKILDEDVNLANSLFNYLKLRDK